MPCLFRSALLLGLCCPRLPPSYREASVVTSFPISPEDLRALGENHGREGSGTPTCGGLRTSSPPSGFLLASVSSRRTSSNRSSACCGVRSRRGPSRRPFPTARRWVGAATARVPRARCVVFPASTRVGPPFEVASLPVHNPSEGHCGCHVRIRVGPADARHKWTRAVRSVSGHRRGPSPALAGSHPARLLFDPVSRRRGLLARPPLSFCPVADPPDGRDGTRRVSGESATVDSVHGGRGACPPAPPRGARLHPGGRRPAPTLHARRDRPTGRRGGAEGTLRAGGRGL